jgi:hypothetical protein
VRHGACIRRSPAAAECASSSTYSPTAGLLNKLSTARQQQPQPQLWAKHGDCGGSRVAVKASVDDAGSEVAAVEQEDAWALCGWEEGPSVVSSPSRGPDLV